MLRSVAVTKIARAGLGCLERHYDMTDPAASLNFGHALLNSALPSPGPTKADPARFPAGGLGTCVLEEQALANLAQLDPTGASKLVSRVLTTYRSSLARLMAQLVAARQPFDAVALKLATHTLKSSSASVGALVFSALCGAAEQALRDGRLDGLQSLLDDLVVEAERVDAAVFQLLSST